MVHALSFFIAQAVPAGAEPPSTALNFLPQIVLMIVIMYFVAIRPQQQQRKKLEEMINNIKTGDEVVVSGIHGVVANVRDGSTLTLKIADNVRIEVEKSAVTTVAKKVELEKA